MAARMEGYKGSRTCENGGFWRIGYGKKMAEAKYRMMVRDNHREWWIDLGFDFPKWRTNGESGKDSVVFHPNLIHANTIQTIVGTNRS
jgi:hypothetical protein